jgi:hypothetical protein
VNPKTIRSWGQIIVSVYALSLLVAIGVFAFAKNLVEVENTIVGAVLGYAAACVHFFIGDTSGSQTKDDVIAASSPPPGRVP